MHIKVNTNIKLSIGYYQHFKTACILELLSKTKFSFIRLFLNFILKGLRFHRSHRLGEKFFGESISKSSKHKNQFALGYIIYIMLHLIFSITSYLSNFSVTWKCMVGQVQNMRKAMYSDYKKHSFGVGVWNVSKVVGTCIDCK